MPDKRKRRQDLLDKYRAADTYLKKADRANGLPGLIAGTTPAGDPVLIKVWPRVSGKEGDVDLREIWLHEIRQLHRLAAYPGARDTIANLLDASFDDKNFYLVLTPGQRRPLALVRQSAGSGHWLNHPNRQANRWRIWENLKRLARGLETLHSQGLLHRRLDEWAVLTAGSEEDDFQLTGFEWSMRIASSQGARRTVAAPVGGSFVTDWQQFGLLAASLLGADQARLLDPEIVPHMVAAHLSAEESWLLRELVQAHELIRHDGEMVMAHIETIQRTLRAEMASRAPRLVLALRLGPGVRLSEEIRNASGLQIEVDDTDSQVQFVKDDLEGGPLLYLWKTEVGQQRMTIRGRQLRYQLAQYRHLTADAQPTWDLAYCENIDAKAPVHVAMEGESKIVPSAMLEIISLVEARRRYQYLRGKVTSWEDWRREVLGARVPATPEQTTYKALLLLQIIEMLLAAADVYPVELVGEPGAETENGATESKIRVRVRQDVNREALSKALKLESPALRLEKALVGDGVRPEGWALTDSGSIADRSEAETEWAFAQVETIAGGERVFAFAGSQQPAMARELFLIPRDAVGSGVQFRRRMRALKALREHQELLRMLVDPRHRVLDSHDTVNEDEAFQQLDPPKQEALRALVSVVPFYLVQGPPGVGKTRLVRDLVRQRLIDEPTSRLLLTAQSNAAVNHLLSELHSVLGAAENRDLLVVRSKSKDDSGTAETYDIAEQSRRLLDRLSESRLAGELPKELRDKLRDLVGNARARTARDNEATERSGPRNDADRSYHAFEGVVARAANVVFATTNSRELDRLIEERGQVDWAIVEEAAKATGTELVAPMLLSHRRLMIGDHNQLPAFGAHQLEEILRSEADVKLALSAGQEFIGRSLRVGAADEFFEEIDRDDSELSALCDKALSLVGYFGAAIETEFERQRRGGHGKSIASKLTAQHRMHPAIADLVSRCFYSGELTTPDDVAARFRDKSAPFASRNAAALPSKPIVVVNMQYVQAVKGHDAGERAPRWHNPSERMAIADVLAALEARPGLDKPSLAVLSPYARQVKRLDEMISGYRSNRLSNLAGFKYPSSEPTFCHTVDSFQGSEADVVVVSLVRNNHHGNARSALGFLSDARRMNVLLSRARWQLILVGSLDFLEVVVDTAQKSRNTDGIEAVTDLVKHLRAGIAADAIAVVSPGSTGEKR